MPRSPTFSPIEKFFSNDIFFSLGTFARQHNENVIAGDIDLLQTNAATPTLAASVGAKVPTARSFPSPPTAEIRYVSTGSLVGSDPEGEAMNTSFQSWEITPSAPVAPR